MPRDHSPAYRRYQARTWSWMAIYVAVLLAAIWLFDHHPPAGPLKYVLAVVPAAPLLGVIASLGLFLKEETDEFQRGLTVQQMLWGTGVTLTAVTVWGFLERLAGAPHYVVHWVVLVWFVAFSTSRVIVAGRYR